MNINIKFYLWMSVENGTEGLLSSVHYIIGIVEQAELVSSPYFIIELPF